LLLIRCASLLKNVTVRRRIKRSAANAASKTLGNLDQDVDRICTISLASRRWLAATACGYLIGQPITRLEIGVDQPKAPDTKTPSRL
jgi:hypothetical protein